VERLTANEATNTLITLNENSDYGAPQAYVLALGPADTAGGHVRLPAIGPDAVVRVVDADPLQAARRTATRHGQNTVNETVTAARTNGRQFAFHLQQRDRLHPYLPTVEHDVGVRLVHLHFLANPAAHLEAVRAVVGGATPARTGWAAGLATRRFFFGILSVIFIPASRGGT
jgi:hypothetical protein